MMRKILTTAFFTLGLAFAAQAAEPTDPEKFVRETAENVLQQIDGKREEIRNNQEVAEDIIEKSLLPHVDVDYISRLVLARHWRSASEEQREAFQDAFYDFLVKSYSSGLAEFTDESFNVLPLRGEIDQRRTIVQTEVKRDNGQSVPVAFTLRWTGDSWKLYDVIIEGISYVRNYRTDFNTEIEQKGIDAVIERLREGKADVGVESDVAKG
ncbi:MAG: ABC transporter substrate-binding protein [Gammaproteobacteria bacterium]|nr:ABC transporter substrate-binding protein [Gammaproteobacteria bacterium]